jgi:hypothetical protein
MRRIELEFEGSPGMGVWFEDFSMRAGTLEQDVMRKLSPFSSMTRGSLCPITLVPYAY